MGVNYARLVEAYKQKPKAEADGLIREHFVGKDIDHRDFEPQGLFIECFGWHHFHSFRSAGPKSYEDVLRMMNQAQLSEAEGAVSTSAFSGIIGQWLFSGVLDSYNMEPDVFTSLIPTQDAVLLDGERIPGVTEIGDEAMIRYEGDPYQPVGFGEDWVLSPPIVDRGFNVPVTWEVLFVDRTGGRVRQRATDVGKWLKRNIEKRAIDCVIDENRTSHRYNWRGTVIQSYGDNTGSHTWDNLAATNALIDQNSVNTVEQVFNAITDPWTGEPITFEMTDLVAAKGLELAARRILRSGEIRTTVPGFATTANPTQYSQANPHANMYNLRTSRLLATRMNVTTSWYVGSIRDYARRMVAEPINVVQAPALSHDDYHRRIVLQTRANERSAFIVVNPRAMVKSTVA